MQTVYKAGKLNNKPSPKSCLWMISTYINYPLTLW